MTVSLKNNRIDIRVDDINKETLERAAQIKNLSLTAYITSVCLNQAKLDIQENEIEVMKEQNLAEVQQTEKEGTENV